MSVGAIDEEIRLALQPYAATFGGRLYKGIAPITTSGIYAVWGKQPFEVLPTLGTSYEPFLVTVDFAVWSPPENAATANENLNTVVQGVTSYSSARVQHVLYAGGLDRADPEFNAVGNVARLDFQFNGDLT